MKNVESVDFTKGDQQRDFVHVSDVVSAFNTVINRVSLLKRDFYQYEVGYGAQATLKEYIELIKKEFDLSLLAFFFLGSIGRIGHNLEFQNKTNSFFNLENYKMEM